MTELCTSAEVDKSLAELPNWERDGDQITARYERTSFADAIAFVVLVGFLAEAADHHPDITVNWRNVTLALTTHDAGGLTELDFELARRIEAVA